MDGSVGDYMRHRKYIGAKDRANIVERAYAIVRAYARLCWWIAKEGREPTPRHLLIAWLALGEGVEAPRIEALFDGTQYGPQALNDDEIFFARAVSGQPLEHADMPEAVRVECPPEWEPVMRARFGADFAAELAATMNPAPLDLRVNLRKISREQAQASLGKDRVETMPTRWSPWGLRTKGKVYLSHTKAFVKGLIEIQDEGSQLIGFLCDARPGNQVLDYCAGAGGKTLALAAAMNNKGRIVATDIEEARLMKARPRFKRAGVADIIEVRPLSDEKNRKWLRRQKGTFDAVLVDAPCSGTGTWRRNPDMRWRAFGPKLEELQATQADILDRVGKTVKPGGRLVYATCSMLPSENEDQIDAFLKRDPGFTVLPIEQAWPADAGEPPCAGPYMRLTPARHNTDGFFAAVLVRDAAAVDEKRPNDKYSNNNDNDEED
jgi:16S rRNA (cytosine967-C5)-methyltransferase